MKPSGRAKSVLLAACTLAFCAVGQAQTTLVYDGFNYSAGSLAGQNGGTGWTSAWTHVYGSGSSLQVSASGMSYAGLTVTGGSAVWGPGGNNISEGTRTLPSLMNTGVVYLQFLSQFAATSGGGTPNLRLFKSNLLTGGIGGNGGAYGGKMSLLDSNLNAAADGSWSSSANLSSLNFVVARIDYEDDLTELWINPVLASFDYLNPTLPDVSVDGFAPEFDSFAFYTRSPGQMDEFRIMSVPVPEPGLISLALLGGVLWCLGRNKNSGRKRAG